MTKWYEVADDALKQMSRDKGIPLIDIREPEEYAEEFIKGSINIPLSTFSSVDWSPFVGKRVAIYCKKGRRTLANRDPLMQVGFSEIYCFPGGIEQWKNCGLPTENKEICPIGLSNAEFSQIQMVFGALIVGASTFVMFYPTLGLLPFWVIGGGQLLAGITGICFIRKIIQRMPWNRR